MVFTSSRLRLKFFGFNGKMASWPKGQLPSFIFNAQIRDGGLQLKHPRRRSSACSPEATSKKTAWTHKSSFCGPVMYAKVSLIGCNARRSVKKHEKPCEVTIFDCAFN